jgi:hypothetical protein
MQVVNLLDFRTFGGERHPHRVLLAGDLLRRPHRVTAWLAAIPAHRRVVVVRARVDDDAVGRITLGAEERTAYSVPGFFNLQPIYD